VDEEDRALDESGRLTEEAPTLAWRIKLDFYFLEILGVAEGLVQEWKECGHSWVQLFKSEELRSRLSYVDVVELRAAFYLKGWPSLGDTSEEDPFQESEIHVHLSGRQGRTMWTRI
jgi:hypothetical protein